WFQTKEAAGFPVLVMEEEGRVIGFATYGPFRPWPAYKYTVEHSVYVHPAYRRRGVGRQLLQELIRIVDENGYGTLIAGIDSANRASIELHQALGFAYSGTIRRAGYKFGK